MDPTELREAVSSPIYTKASIILQEKSDAEGREYSGLMKRQEMEQMSGDGMNNE